MECGLEASWEGQVAPKTLQEAPKRLPRGSKEAPRRFPRGSQEAPKRSPEQFRTLWGDF